MGISRTHFGLVLSATLGVLVSPAEAQQDQVAAAAEEIARQHNAKASTMIDDEVLSTSAISVGKNVIFSNTMNVGPGLSPEQVARFRAGAFQYVAPRTCQVVLRNDIFKQGLFYTFIYRYRNGDKLTEFVFNLQRCKDLAGR